jgi:vacuolar-type H+-ATPase subunit H
LKARDEAVNKARKAYAEATAQAWEVLKEALTQAEKAYDGTVAPAKKEAEAQAKRGTKDSG